jgi:hypothetical protein
MKNFHRTLAYLLSTCVLAAGVLAVSCATPEPSRPPSWLDQGRTWTPSKRYEFYTLDQGSRLMPFSWMRALKRWDGRPFMEDKLLRYGFLLDTPSSPLPLGFTVAGPRGGSIGMTCAACHTREIRVAGTTYRIDGGPALIDFQKFLYDLDAAVQKVATSAHAFDPFARDVLGSSHSPDQKAVLKSDVAKWQYRFHTLMNRARPDSPWGVGRVDAVGMIFNRLTGLDLGPPPTFVIEENIKQANAPVRYPFLWNAEQQEQTQWTGFASNRYHSSRLGRNLGQVFGVFAEFQPEPRPLSFFNVDYLKGNSANFEGLEKLEYLMSHIGPPRWPWPVDNALRDKGEILFNDNCGNCHGRPNHRLWETKIVDVGTDQAAARLLGRRASTGALRGAILPFTFSGPLSSNETALTILTTAVKGSIIQHYLTLKRVAGADQVRKLARELTEMFQQRIKGYEARVLEGVWAAAPYLHNGSVQTLAELLKPSAERARSFKVGPNYDLVNVGLSTRQGSPATTMTTTDCGDIISGNSRCGHEYGVHLSDEEKRALLEYLKTL